MLTKALIANLLRCLFFFSHPSRVEGGFILPTTVLLILVVTLAVGSMTIRTLNRTSQVMGDREQRIIYNAATPALERAKAKLEFLFDSERNFLYPNGIPDQDVLHDMMISEANGDYWLSFEDADGDEVDPYTFPDAEGSYTSDEAETRISIDGDTTLDNAWSYRVDLDDDGTLDATVAYSILFDKPPSGDTYNLENASNTAISERAKVLQVRHGPLSIPVRDDGCGGSGGASTESDDGWSKPEQGGATIYKNFQVNAFVLPDDPAQTVATLEFHQDRKIDEGNKWGAWFRNDLEIYPGAEFNWNGAMHTEGSLFMGNSNYEGYLISSPASCYYSREDSEVTVADRSTALQDNNFEGQFVSAQMKDNRWSNDNKSIFHLYEPNGNITDAYKPQLNKGNDSVKETGNAVAPDDYLLDPVVLLTQDISKARDFPNAQASEDGNPADSRDEDWNEEDSDFFKERRLYNQTEDTPSVDDSFRADDRYGPKARVNDQPIPGKIGEAIGSGQDDLTNLGDGGSDFNNVGLDGYWERRARAEGARFIVGQRLELGNTFGWGGVDPDGDHNTLSDLPSSASDIDKANDVEPLMPWDGCNENTNNSSRCGEARQRRTLRDNLAAVQATAIYHASETNGDKDFPVACLASTVHPGTPYTLQDGATFLNWFQGLEDYWNSADVNTNNEILISDFFRGEGTNGWEYETPSGGSPSAFAGDLASTKPLGKALRNLAHFAGDPFAGAPSFTPQQDRDIVHPFPILSMWGDFSILRRILDQGTSYANLSPADKTTLQTAACSLGMLANELYILEKFNYNATPADTKYGANDGHTLLDVLNARLVALSLDKPENPNTSEQSDYDAEVLTELNRQSSVALTALPDYWKEPPLNQKANKDYGYYKGTTTLEEDFDDLGDADPEAYIARLQQWHDADLLAFENDNVSNAADRLQQFNVDDDLINLAKIIMLREQTIRDRTFGFLLTSDSASPNCTGTSYYQSGAYGTVVNVLRNNPDGLHRLCSNQLKFGALYSIFPGENPTTVINDQIDAGDRHGEWIFSRGLDNDESDIVQSTSFNGNYDYEPLTVDDLDDMRLKPLEPNDWKLPHGVPSAKDDTKLTPNYSGALVVSCNVELCSSGVSPSTHSKGGLYQTQTMNVAVKDASIYDGREYMSVRLLDLDLDMLRQNNDGLDSSDRWLPNSGIVYAFREDAVREDAITRPTFSSSVTWSNCDTDADFSTGASDCHMANFNLAAEDATDPPLNDTNSISPKPVDYAPDPDRRPNGFRLTNGEKLKRPSDAGRGLSFVTDNALYIKGDFNLHQNSAGTALEEFDDYLLYSETDSNFDKFYERKSRDASFSTIAGDEWRPSELLADAITILSGNFCDGSMFDTFHSAKTGANNVEVKEEETDSQRKIKGYSAGSLESINRPWRSLYGCVVTGASKEQTSYTNGVFPKVNITTNQLAQGSSLSGFEEYWHHANPYDTHSPYVITRQGNPRMPTNGSPYADKYFSISDNDPFKRPSPASFTNVNAIIISGTVPSRPGQSYGGLHNFPRMLENWGGSSRNNGNDDVGLRISGSLMQLNFSHTAVSPYDHDAWEPGTESDTEKQPIDYYWPPKRLWGYDVGLQKGVAGPMAKRFVSGAEPTRSEFYSEPPADDPYIYNLCQAVSNDECFRDPPLS